ncbi:MAG: 4-alpha-glucanotransferase [Mycobacteriaceae bacterium]|nr:4-alpha-glucanotransferase [Mycobacteriaceae bacterium]
MAQHAPSLVELAERYGIATQYADWAGRDVFVAEATLVSILAAFGVPAQTEPQRCAALHACHRSYWSRPLPAVIVSPAATATSFWAHVTDGAPADVWLQLEDGTLCGEVRQIENFTAPFNLDGRWIGEASFMLPNDLPLGYHRVYLRSGADQSSTTLIVTPDWLGLPTRLAAQRSWGVAVQLYSVRSQQSWGVGDLVDLADLAVWSASQHGAGFVLVNPLHAAAPTLPMEPSPYLPTSRRFANPLYLRVEAIPEFAYLRKRRRVRQLRADVQHRARQHDVIDRDTAWAAKRKALTSVYRVHRAAGRELAYRAYRAREGKSLDDFATWCALADHYGADWHRWPGPLQHPASPAVAEFVHAHPHTVDFHRWLQWQLDEQLAAAQAKARYTGMALGIMHDLAVGVHPHGADAWLQQDGLASGVTVGAPPDEFNQVGQNWSQPPWRPDRLEEQAYQPFRALVQAILRHAGGVRIDHIIGLFRLWWIPNNATPADGTYVRYNHEALVGIVALEAYRAGAVVVGEDLGTVEPWVRSYLQSRGVLGTSLLWFELDRDTDPTCTLPLPAQRWREHCLASIGTHDLPPAVSYLAGDHVRLRDSLNLLSRPVEQELQDNRAQVSAWLAELRRVGLLPDEASAEHDPEHIMTALHAYLGRTPSRLLAMSLADAVGDRQTQNQPGTTNEYPNWRVPLTGPTGQPMMLEDVFTEPGVAALAETMRAQTAAPSTSSTRQHPGH